VCIVYRKKGNAWESKLSVNYYKLLQVKFWKQVNMTCSGLVT